jgi:5-methylcytosine-specific restriction protein A
MSRTAPVGRTMRNMPDKTRRSFLETLQMKMLTNRIATLDTRTAKPPPTGSSDPFYQSPTYRAWRDTVVARAGGYCQDPQCKTPNRRPSRLFADHVIELKDGGAPLDLANGLALCGSCHTRKTAKARADRQARRY